MHLYLSYVRLAEYITTLKSVEIGALEQSFRIIQGVNSDADEDVAVENRK